MSYKVEEEKDGVNSVSVQSIQDWRQWLEEYHQTARSVWLIMYKKDSGLPTFPFTEAIDTALCFGWVDSKANKRDDKSYYQYFAKRNPKSNWSRINKEKIERLIKDGRIAPAGLEMVAIAKENGTWTALDDVENLIIPADLQVLFDQQPTAFQYWELFPRSVKRSILEWILNAKRPETRTKRINETVNSAAKNIRANQYRQ